MARLTKTERGLLLEALAHKFGVVTVVTRTSNPDAPKWEMGQRELNAACALCRKGVLVNWAWSDSAHTDDQGQYGFKVYGVFVFRLTPEGYEIAEELQRTKK